MLSLPTPTPRQFLELTWFHSHQMAPWGRCSLLATRGRQRLAEDPTWTSPSVGISQCTKGGEEAFFPLGSLSCANNVNSEPPMTILPSAWRKLSEVEEKNKTSTLTAQSRAKSPNCSIVYLDPATLEVGITPSPRSAAFFFFLPKLVWSEFPQLVTKRVLVPKSLPEFQKLLLWSDTKQTK